MNKNKKFWNIDPDLTLACLSERLQYKQNGSIIATWSYLFAFKLTTTQTENELENKKVVGHIGNLRDVNRRDFV